FDRIEAFRAANVGSRDLVIPDRADLAFEACLAPAVCYHTYHSFEGQQIDPAGSVVTAAGRCFRYESTNLTGLERLGHFTMRQLVFLGTAELAAAQRRAAVDAIIARLEHWNPEGAVTTANDPFFPTTYPTKRSFQLASDLKYELHLPVGGDGEQ